MSLTFYYLQVTKFDDLNTKFIVRRLNNTSLLETDSLSASVRTGNKEEEVEKM